MTPIKPTEPDLRAEAAQARRRRENRSLDDSWRRVEALVIGPGDDPATRGRLRHAFHLGWQAATEYHTARPRGVRP